MSTPHHFFPASVFTAMREQRLTRFSAESFNKQNPIDSPESVQKSAKMMENRNFPTTDREGVEYVDALINRTQDELNRRVLERLTVAAGRIEYAMANIPHLPAEGRQHLQTMLREVNAEIDRQRVGGLLRYIGGVNIEYRPGEQRPMTMRDGSVRNVTLVGCSYGSMPRAMGRDGDRLDFYLGPDIENCVTIFRINQGDEFKDMIGFKAQKDAHDAYCRNHPEKKPDQVPMPTPIPINEYRRMVSGAGTAAA